MLEDELVRSEDIVVIAARVLGAQDHEERLLGHIARRGQVHRALEGAQRLRGFLELQQRHTAQIMRVLGQRVGRIKHEEPVERTHGLGIVGEQVLAPGQLVLAGRGHRAAAVGRCYLGVREQRVAQLLVLQEGFGDEELR